MRDLPYHQSILINDGVCKNEGEILKTKKNIEEFTCTRVNGSFVY